MRDLIVMIGFIGLLPICFMRPAVGMLVWTWFAIMNPHRETYGFAQTFAFNQYIVLVVVAGWLLSKERKTPMMTMGILTVFLWFGWTLVTTIYAPDPDTSFEFFYRIPEKVFIYIVFMFILIDRAERVVAMVWMFCMCIGYYSFRNGVVGILKGGGNLGNAENFGPMGTLIQDRNHLGLAMVMILPLLHFLSKHVAENRLKLLLNGVMFFNIVAIFVSYSRGAFLALLCVGAYYWFGVKNKFTYLVVALVVGISGYSMMPQEFKDRMNIAEKIKTDESFQGRVRAWEFATLIADMRPMLGGGFRVTENPMMVKKYGEAVGHTKPLAAHSVYFQVLGEHGYFGLGLYLLMMVCAYFSTVLTRRRTKNVPGQEWAYDLAGALQASQIGFAFGSAALSLAYFDGFYIIIALCFILNYLTAKRSEELTRIKGKKKVSVRYVPIFGRSHEKHKEGTV